MKLQSSALDSNSKVSILHSSNDYWNCLVA
nr:MAG TPA: SH3 domain (SH3b1 type) [Caudoviricetes sp.]